ncbi:MAG: sulfite exporter TauE/SafE family protein [Bacteroidota bacterium]
MSWQLLISGFALGIISSFHCVGMCGPIALSLPVYYLPPQKKLIGILFYHSGRIFLYAMLGLFFGFVGRQFYLAGLQQYFSIALGCIILLILIQTTVGKKLIHFKLLDQYQEKLQNIIAIYIQKKQLYGMLILGMANGLLPCGMVYLAITGAMAAGNLMGGMLFMAFFGLGTFPAMFLLTYFGSFISLKVRNNMKKAIPFFVATMAILLILRGLNLNIPMISPVMNNSAAQVVDCP